jgi:hypothetical protein
LVVSCNLGPAAGYISEHSPLATAPHTSPSRRPIASRRLVFLSMKYGDLAGRGVTSARPPGPGASAIYQMSPGGPRVQPRPAQASWDRWLLTQGAKQRSFETPLRPSRGSVAVLDVKVTCRRGPAPVTEMQIKMNKPRFLRRCDAGCTSCPAQAGALFGNCDGDVRTPTAALNTPMTQNSDRLGSHPASVWRHLGR